ncbi:hypothetical protein [Laspinema olomoucense]|uniref:Uncharacterized protein n=1 Tax=Laspinema olomoucense D3b TaxID=2953688 RepID=A0ABT2N9Z3_9CYAN|nr:MULTISPECIES: hypothetical protein [unclassified Laspinema]MCT7974919.1 hypothetical protein [Laspinema sp. D3d]MCT7979276.1 hypothetical protein [Laspinema sp. D3b]MCT7994755.1 hypothetical protein [Laspinema sp. D3c]
MTLKATPAQLPYLPPLATPLNQAAERILPLQRRAISALVVTLLLLILTYTLDVLSVWASIATSTALSTLCLLNILTTTLTLLTGVAGIAAAMTFVSYRAKVLRCGSPRARMMGPLAPSSLNP